MKFLNLLISLRYDLIAKSKARRHRFRIVDRLNNKTVAYFDDETTAKATIAGLQQTYLKEITSELTKAGISV